MKLFSLADLRELKPCYDPVRYLPEDWLGTVVDLLQVDACPPTDRIWIATKLIDEKTARLFFIWCVREDLKLTNTDPRAFEACDVAERYAHGQATADELRVAAPWVVHNWAHIYAFHSVHVAKLLEMVI
jgi:hypothetical protein